MAFSRFAIAALTLALFGSAALAQEPAKDAAPFGDSAPAAVPAPMPSRIRVAGNVAQAQIVHMVTPVYPPLAKTAGITGTIVLHAIIARDGSMSHLEFVSGPPLLMRAAMDAVAQWWYKPTLLNGQPVEVDTTISVIFTLNGNSPVGTTGGDHPSSPSTEPSQPQTRPLGPAPAATQGSSASTGSRYPDTIEGMKAQMHAALEAWRSTYKQDFFAQLHGFALTDPKAWLTDTFGAEKAAALLPEYETSFAKFEAHITYVGGFWEKSATCYLIVENSDVPKPEEGDENSKPPKPFVPLKLENFRFMVKTGQEDPGDWVFSFVYLDGAFRIVGGTRTFWDENWRLKRDKAAFAAGDAHWQLAYADPSVIEGVATKCPGDGFVRVFVAAKVQATRLREKRDPVYPPEAKNAGIQGIVLFHAIIATDGSVKELTLEDGNPILAKSAEVAVRQWRYEPLIYRDKVEGKDRPAEVDTVIAVEFKFPQ